MYRKFLVYLGFILLFKQNTAYEMRISDWISNVCSSDLDDRATSNSGTIISSGSIGDFSQPTKPKPQTAATRLVTIGVTMPTTLRMYNASARINAPSVTAKIQNICASYS